MTPPHDTDRDPRLSLPERDPRPVVGMARRRTTGGPIAAIAVVAALLLFVALEARRRGPDRPRLAGAVVPMIASPAPLVVPPEPSPPPESIPPPPVRTIVVPPPIPIVAPPRPPQVVRRPAYDVPAPMPAPPLPPEPAAPRRPQGRLNEPAIVIDGGAEVRRADGANGDGEARARADGTGEEAAIRATVLRSRTDVMPVGTLIPAILETPIDTARPGLVRALVSRDTAGFDGRHVLIPRGSRLIGEYQSDIRGGQDRVLMTWNRLIRPDGVSIRLASPAADALGGAGVPGRVHSFFLQRFAGAVLQSALQVGVALASRPGNGSVIVGAPAASVGAIGQQVQAANDYRPKITVKQGTVVNIFVARDLDFSGVAIPRQEGR